MSATVQILLATYNGEQFLREQLDSLFRQSFQNFILLVRDDGSKDKTVTILKKYQLMFPDKIVILEDDNKNVGATQNFGILLKHASANYIFFCDQDDIWLEHKLEISVEKLKTLENGDQSVPCMVYSDMKAVDAESIITADSVWKQLKLHPDYCTLNRLLIQNIPHGCTMGINKAMRDLAYPLPTAAILHDHWIALLAAACGKYSALMQPLLHLRTHSQNVTRKKNSLQDKLKRFSGNFLTKNTYEYFIRIRVAQAKALKERIAGQLTPEQLKLLDDFILLENTKGYLRKRIFLHNKFFRTTFWHTFKMIARA